MKRWQKRLGVALVLAVLGGGAAWLAHRAHDGGAGTQDATFWCPMHPQIRRHEPGTCPI